MWVHPISANSFHLNSEIRNLNFIFACPLKISSNTWCVSITQNLIKTFQNVLCCSLDQNMIVTQEQLHIPQKQSLCEAFNIHLLSNICSGGCKRLGIFCICHQKPLEAIEIFSQRLLTWIAFLIKGDYFSISSRKCSIRMLGNREVLGRPSVLCCGQICKFTTSYMVSDYRISKGVKCTSISVINIFLNNCALWGVKRWICSFLDVSP